MVSPFDLSLTPLERGRTLIEASAGTGKTYAIAGLYVRLLVEFAVEISVRNILVVTYTEAATEELRTRIRKAVSEAHRAFCAGGSEVSYLQALVERVGKDQHARIAQRLSDALAGFDEACIFTIHGFCQRTLSERAFESGSFFDMELLADASDLVREGVEDFWRREFCAGETVAVQLACRGGYTPESLAHFVGDCLRHADLELRPPVDGAAWRAQSDRLEALLNELRDLWKKEGAAVRAMFGAQQRWAKRPYNDDAEMAERFSQMELCLAVTGLLQGDVSCLELFCSSRLEQGVRANSKVGPPVHRFFELCEEWQETRRVYGIGLRELAVAEVSRELRRRKLERKVQAFDDLLVGLRDALRSGGGAELARGLRSQFAAALIDEFQDTDPVQYEIFSTVFDASRHLFLIGDPKQAIYGFRGADVHTYLEAAEDASRRYTLEVNRRSEAGLVAAVNTIFGSASRPFVIGRFPFHPVKAWGQADSSPLRIGGRRAGGLCIWHWKGEKKIARGVWQAEMPGRVAGEIARLLEWDCRVGERALRPEDIAVLVETNRQAELMQAALNAAGIPNVQHTSASVFGTGEAEQVRWVLAAMARPAEEGRLKAALAASFMGWAAREIGQLSSEEDRWQEIVERFYGYQEVWMREGFLQAFRRWMNDYSVRSRLLGAPNGERALTNLLHLGEILHEEWTRRRLGPQQLVEWLADQIQGGPRGVEEHELRLERDENAVKLVTIHKSKGLEYPVVFYPFAFRNAELRGNGREDERVLFHAPEHGQLVWDLGSDEIDEGRELAQQEIAAENARLFYVALTRAKHRCYLAWGKVNQAHSSAPAWLFHLHGAAAGELEDRFDALTDGVIEADLRRLAEAAEVQQSGSISIEPVPAPPDHVYRASAGVASSLAPRQFQGDATQRWRISSFSGLTTGRREELPDADRSLPERGEGAREAELPRGAAFGSCLHEILEQMDFGVPEGWETLARARLGAYGMDPEVAPLLSRLLDRTMRLPLRGEREGGVFTLQDLTAADRMNELEFWLPANELTPQSLGAALQTCRRAEIRRFAGAVSELPFAELRGYLTGFIDLVFQADGKFWVLDWKSNWLGAAPEDYQTGALVREMSREYYFLQYHLYAVAVHRFLQGRVRDYRYDTHFGGVFYLFLRGVDPGRPDLGVFYDRPSAALLRRLEAALEGGGT